MERVLAAVGLLVFPFVAWLFSFLYFRGQQSVAGAGGVKESARARRAVAKGPFSGEAGRRGPLSGALALGQFFRYFPVRVVVWGFILQFGFALLLLKTEAGAVFFAGVRDVFHALIGFSEQGTALVFGSLGTQAGHAGTLGVAATDPSALILAIHGLMPIVFVGALTAVLYQLRILPRIVAAFAWLMRRTLGTSGAESLGTATNVFVGFAESALVVRPYLERMTSSEFFALLVGGMATIAGNVMVVYAMLGADPGHLLTASIISAPAALMIAKLMMPETGKPVTSGHTPLERSRERPYANLIDAAATGAAQGIKLVIAIVAMLVAFLALIAMVDFGLSETSTALGAQTPLTLERIFGWIFLPFTYLIGVPVEDVEAIAPILGVKTVLNEFLGYMQLVPAYTSHQISARGYVVATYALCGFANFGSIAIAIGGIGGVVEKRRREIAKLGIRALIGGTLAAFMTASIASLVLSDEDIEARLAASPPRPAAAAPAPARESAPAGGAATPVATGPVRLTVSEVRETAGVVQVRFAGDTRLYRLPLSPGDALFVAEGKVTIGAVTPGAARLADGRTLSITVPEAFASIRRRLFARPDRATPEAATPDGTGDVPRENRQPSDNRPAAGDHP